MKTRECKVLYRRQPAWLVGERAADREARIAAGVGVVQVEDSERYPGDYAGRIIAVIPASREFTPADLADPSRGVVTLTLTDAERAALACRRSRVVLGAPGALAAEAVSFDEHWGALAPVLRRNFDDPERVEREDDDTPRSESWRFRELAALAGDFLPPTKTHTGAGLYKVDASGDAHNDTIAGASKDNGTTTVTLTTGISRDCTGEVLQVGGNSYSITHKTTDTEIVVVGDASGESGSCTISAYSTIGSAVGQLWTDQGSAEFTAAQEIRIYDGTYTETVALNSGLRPLPKYRLIIKAADGNDSVILKNDGLSGHAFNDSAVESITLQGFEVQNNIAGSYYALLVSGTSAYLSNMTIKASSTHQAFYLANLATLIEDCTFEGTNVWLVRSHGYDAVWRRCTFQGGVYDLYGCSVAFESCVFDGCGILYYGTAVAPRRIAPTVVSNCLFYNATYAFKLIQAGQGLSLKVRNCIFHTVTTCLENTGGPIIFLESNRNCFYNCGKVGSVDGTDYTSLTDWQAYSPMFGDSPDADSIDDDPKLTNPASDDFSLQPDSPCRHAGVGVGVEKDADGDEFDLRHPDIGAASTGTVEAPEEPSVEITAVDGSTVGLSLSGDDEADHFAELVNARTGEVVDADSRAGDGTLVLTAPELAARYFVSAWSETVAGRSEPAGPLEVFLPEGESPFEEVRVALVARLGSHAGLEELLGTDETGAVPIYAARPGLPVRVPSVVYTFEGTPDSALDRPGRWLVKVSLEAWGGSPGVNDRIVAAMDEVLSREPFDCTSWSVKRIRRVGDETRWSGDGRTESRRTEWALVVDRLGS